MAKANGKKPAKTTVKSTAVVKRPQPHGGALNQGGTPGNRGGSGRPPSAIRASIRAALDKRWKIVDEIAGDADEAATDRLRAVEFMAKYGLDATVSVADVRECLQGTLDDIRDFLTPGQADELLAIIARRWARF